VIFIIYVLVFKGTIGLIAAKRAKKVIGVEIRPQAVDDANLNAKFNGIILLVNLIYVLIYSVS